MPTYGQRFIREERALPDWSRRPISRELWPKELLDAVDPEDEDGRRKKKRRLELTKVSALPSAEEAFGLVDPDALDEDEEGGRNLLERLNAMEDHEGEHAEGEEDEVPFEEEEQDEAYDDEDAGDYDAENYFDNGDEMGDDGGDEGDGEGTF